MHKIAEQTRSRSWMAVALAAMIISTIARPAETPLIQIPSSKARQVDIALPPNQHISQIALAPATARRTDHKEWKKAITAANGAPLIARGNDARVYMRVAPRTLRAMDISAAGQLQIAGDFSTPHEVEFLAASMTTILVAGENTVSLLHASDGTTRYSQLLPEPVIAVALDDDYASVITREGSLLQLRMTEPIPAFQRFAFAGPFPSTFALSPNRIAYIDGSDVVIAVPDLTTPSVRTVARTTLDAPALALRWMSNALLIINARGTTLMTLTAGEHLEWASHLDHAVLARPSPHVATDDTLVAIRRSEDTTTLIDTGLPQHQEILGFLPATSNSVQTFTHAARFLVEISPHDANVWDLAALPAPLTNEYLAPGEGVNLGGQRRAYLDTTKKLLYVADWFSGLHIYDVSSVDRPRLLSSFHTPGSPKGVVVRNNIAYVADDDHGLRLIDVSDARHPHELTALNTPGLAYTPVLDGEMLYLASHRGGFQIIDITDPKQPRLVSDVRTGGKAWSIAVRDHIAYVACSEAGLWIYDVRNPAQPTLLSRYAPGANAEEIILDGTHAYVAFFEGSVHVLDIAQPQQPQHLATLATRGNARGLALRDTSLFIADWFAGIRLADIRDPSKPRVMADIDTPGAAWGIKLDENRAYVLDWWGGLVTLDITAPAQAHTIDRFPACAECSDIDVNNRYSYVAAGHRGVFVFDIKNALNPTWIAGLDFAQPARYLARVSDTLIVAGSSEISLVDTRDPFNPQRRATVEACAGIEWLRGGPGYIAAGCRDELRIFALDPARLTLTPYAQEYGQFADAVTLHNTWVAVARNGSVVPIVPTAPNTFPDDFRLPLQSALLRAHRTGDKLLLIAEKQVTVLIEQDNTLRLLTDNNLSAGNGSSLVIDDTLLVNRAQGITAFHLHADGRLTEQSHYPLANSIAGMAIHNGYVYSTGTGFVTAIRLLPKWPVTGATPNHATLSFPATLPAGRYALVFLDADGSARRLDHAVEVSAFALNHRVPLPLRPGVMQE